LYSDLAIECFEKARRSRPLKPLQSLKDFRIIYDGSSKCTSDGRGEKSPTRLGSQAAQDRPKAHSSVRRARSLSPMKENGATVPRDATRGKTTATVPKSTSMYPTQSYVSGKEKRPLQESATVRSDVTKQGPDTASATRIRPSRRAKEVDSKDNGLSVDESTKTAGQRTIQTDSTHVKTAPTSTVNHRQSHGTLKEPQSQKKKVTGNADSTEDNRSQPCRGS